MLQSSNLTSRWRTPLAVFLALLLLAALLGWWRTQTNLSAPQVDRLRMQALVGQDIPALPQLRQAAGRGNLLAQRALAEVLLRRHDLAAEGVQFAEMAALRGDAAACFLLGRAYFEGGATTNRIPDMGRARHWLELAAEQKHAAAMHLLGLMAKNGYGGQADNLLAARWFARAVQLGHADAMFLLGNAYQAGEGVKQDTQQALRLYQAAAKQEHAAAAQTLALAYRDGQLGLTQDKREAELMLLEVEHILSHPGAH